MTHIYLMRHGEAEAGGMISDHDRELTASGIQRLKNAAKVIKKLGVQPTHVYSSPRLRAKQTAELVAGALGVAVEIRDEVNFSFNVRAIRHLLNGLDDTAEVLFVGHEPSFSEAVKTLTGADVAMKKGGLVRIDLPYPQATRGELVWLIAPKVFDVLANS